MAACVPGEWHVLPARMANTVMHLAGWHVRFAGANTTPDRLRRQLRGDRPTALALSCIMPNHLPAACDLIAVLSAGAYGMTMAGNYNTRPRAAEVMVSGEQAWRIRERETTADLFRHEHLTVQILIGAAIVVVAVAGVVRQQPPAATAAEEGVR